MTKFLKLQICLLVVCFCVGAWLCLNNVFAQNSKQVFADNEENPIISAEDIGQEMHSYFIQYRNDNVLHEQSSEPLRQNDFAGCEELLFENTNFEGSESSVLSLFRLTNLKHLSFAHNKLTLILSPTFANIPQLETLDLSFNEITTITFGNLTSVQNLYLQSNGLKTVDLSIVRKLNDEQPYVNLGQNQIQRVADLTLPTCIGGAYIELYGNKIVDAKFDKTYYSPNQLNLIVQNWTSEQNYDNKTKLTVYQSYGEHNYKVKVTNKNTLQSQFLEAGNEHLLPHATYTVEIYDGNVNLSSLISNENIYRGFDFTIKKSVPVFVAYVDGKIYEPTAEGVSKPITFVFDSEEQGYVVQYKVGNGSYISSNSLTLSTSGKYDIVVRSVNGDDVSKELTLFVDVHIGESHLWTYLIMSLIIACIAICFMLLRLRLNK